MSTEQLHEAVRLARRMSANGLTAEEEDQAAAILRRVPELEAARGIAVELAALCAAERDQLRAELAALRAGGGVPEGWKLVPVEITAEMWAAVNKLDDEMAAGSYDGKGCTIEQAWNCLLSTAPTAPQVVPSDDVILRYMRPWLPCDPSHRDQQDVIDAIRAVIAHPTSEGGGS